MRGKHQHRFSHGRHQSAQRLQQVERPAFAARLRKDVAPGSVDQRDMEVHAGAGVFLDGLGHEAGGDAMPAGGGAHQPLQHHEIVGRLEHVLAVVERQLVLAGRVFGDHRLGRDALRSGASIDVGKQRLHAVQMVDRIDLGLGRATAVEHGARRLHLAISIALVSEQKEFELEGAGRLQPFFGEGSDLSRQGVARIGAHRRAVEMIHRHQHLAARRAGAVERLQRARDRPGPEIAVAGIPDQPGLVHVLAGDVEAKDRDRQMAAVFVQRRQFVTADDLAAADPVGVGEHDVEFLHLGLRFEEGLGFVEAGTGRRFFGCAQRATPTG